MFFAVGDGAILQLGHAAQVAPALGLFHLGAVLLNRFTQFLDLHERAFLALPTRLQGIPLALDFREFLFQSLEPLFAGFVLLAAQSLALDFELHQPPFQPFEFLGHGFRLGAQLGRGLVDQVDGLVRQEPVRNVAMGKLCCGDERPVLDAYAVVQLVPFAQTAQDGDGVLDTRLVEQDGLEAPFEGGVFFDVLAVFFQRRRTDAVEFAPGEHRLEHVASIHRTLGCTRADHRVDLIDEEDDLPLGFDDFLKHSFEALLELTPEFCPGNNGGEVGRSKALVFEAVGHVARDDTARETFDDGSLAHTRLTN